MYVCVHVLGVVIYWYTAQKFELVGSQSCFSLSITTLTLGWYIHKSLGCLISMNQSVVIPGMHSGKAKKFSREYDDPPEVLSICLLKIAKAKFSITFGDSEAYIHSKGPEKVQKSWFILVITAFHIKCWYFKRAGFMGMWPVLSHRALYSEEHCSWFSVILLPSWNF